jgi:hypothetical protein
MTGGGGGGHGDNTKGRSVQEEGDAVNSNIDMITTLIMMATVRRTTKMSVLTNNNTLCITIGLLE